jgi:hypothetical protein
LANSAVSDMSGSLPRWPPTYSGDGLWSLMARSSSRNWIPCPARYAVARARGQRPRHGPPDPPGHHGGRCPPPMLMRCPA